jgi:hypothetical protein
VTAGTVNSVVANDPDEPDSEIGDNETGVVPNVADKFDVGANPEPNTPTDWPTLALMVEVLVLGVGMMLLSV